MKTYIVNILAASLAALAAPLEAANTLPDPQPIEIHLGVGRGFARASAAEVRSNLNDLLVALPPGVKFFVEKGSDGGLITNGAIPRLAYPGRGAMTRALAPQLAALSNWLAVPPSGEGGGNGYLNPPVYLKSVGQHHGNGRVIILLIGDVIYTNGSEPAFSFAPDRLPTLSHLVLSERQTPFGCAERRTLLQGASVYWYYVSADVILFEEYGNQLHNWWQTWVQAQGGALTEFDHSWNLVTGDLLRPVPKPAPLDLAALAGPNPKPLMPSVAKRKIAETTNSEPIPAAPVPEAKPKVEPKPAAPPIVSIVETKPSEETVVIDPSPQPQPVSPVPVPAPVPPVPAPAPDPTPIPKNVDHTVSSVGLYWTNPKVDLDESIRIKPGSSEADPGELYWNTAIKGASAMNPKNAPRTNAIGRYLYDYRHGAQDYEWIELSSALSDKDLCSRYEVWVDNYSGSGPVTFKAVLVDHGTVIATRELTIAGNGDKRRHSSHREDSPSWVRLPIEDMFRSAQPANGTQTAVSGR